MHKYSIYTQPKFAVQTRQNEAYGDENGRLALESKMKEREVFFPNLERINILFTLNLNHFIQKIVAMKDCFSEFFFSFSVAK